MVRFLKPTHLIFFIFISLSVLAQDSSWLAPIQGEILLSGTFGELRGNHYHGGIDIKPNQAGHQKIIAVADGYVSSLKVHGGSYGNGLMITHKNGMKSLYGHLHRFVDAIDSIATHLQYADTSFQLNASLDSTVFPVKKGDVIGYMGNTGYSFGQHLHFEIYDAENRLINPLLIIPAISDQTPPVFRNLRINYLNSKGLEYKDKNISLSPTTSRPEYTVNGFQISLAVDVIDRHAKTHNKNGIYELELWVNDSLYFSSLMDTLDQETRKMYNCQIDYRSDLVKNPPIYHLIHPETGQGIIKLNAYKSKNIRIVASDFHGNKAEFECVIRQSSDVSVDHHEIYNYIIDPVFTQSIKMDKYHVHFPTHSFIQPQKLYVFEEWNVNDNEEQWILHLDRDRIPLLQPVVISLFDDQSIKEKSKYVLAQFENNRIRPLSNTVRKKDRYIATTSTLGDFNLVRDTIAPEVTKELIGVRQWKWTIDDNLFSFSDLKYFAKVNNQWTRVKAINKDQQLLFEDFDRYSSDQEHDFQLIIVDPCHNKTVIERRF